MNALTWVVQVLGLLGVIACTASLTAEWMRHERYLKRFCEDCERARERARAEVSALAQPSHVRVQR